MLVGRIFKQAQAHKTAQMVSWTKWENHRLTHVSVKRMGKRSDGSQIELELAAQMVEMSCLKGVPSPTPDISGCGTAGLTSLLAATVTFQRRGSGKWQSGLAQHIWSRIESHLL